MGDLQDGMLSYYLEQAKASDVNVEKRIDSEPFDYRDYVWVDIAGNPIQGLPCQIFPPLSTIAPSPSIEREPNSR